MRVPAALLVAAAALVFAGCDTGSARAPQDPYLRADTDSTLMVIWNAPSEGTPEVYRVFFRPAEDTVYSLAAETTATRCLHDPGGRTGWYRVAAVFAGQEYACTDEPTTVTVRTDTVVLAELNASGNAGYGWDRSSGRARTYPMTRLPSSTRVDLYLTDFEPYGSTEPPYAIASPEMGPSDPGGVVPADTWRISRFTDPLPAESVYLPSFAPTEYFNYSDIGTLPCYVGCRTEDGHFALLRVVAVDIPAGSIRLESWFQQVKGLRLVGAEPQSPAAPSPPF